MQLGGTLLLNYQHIAAKDRNWQNGAVIEVSPQFGYFLATNLELGLSLFFAKGMGQLFEDSPTEFGLSLGIKYHIDLAKVFLYLGATVGMDFVLPTEGKLQNYLIGGIPFGLLVPLNQHVALDVGMRVNAAIYLHDSWVMEISVPIGYLGVQGYF